MYESTSLRVPASPRLFQVRRYESRLFPIPNSQFPIPNSQFPISQAIWNKLFIFTKLMM
ncbi:MAG: hypothetical protein F6K41_02280 [Symploca sp. SIO3E6]|nr:hypothetical protein [Caldora sp. SIO3E6]